MEQLFDVVSRDSNDLAYQAIFIPLHRTGSVYSDLLYLYGLINIPLFAVQLLL
jgi:hypothetical protein